MERAAAFARRILEARAAGTHEIYVGNRGDFTALHMLTGLEPQIDLDRTLADLLVSLA